MKYVAVYSFTSLCIFLIFCILCTYVLQTQILSHFNTLVDALAEEDCCHFYFKTLNRC